MRYLISEAFLKEWILTSENVAFLELLERGPEREPPDQLGPYHGAVDPPVVLGDRLQDVPVDQLLTLRPLRQLDGQGILPG